MREVGEVGHFLPGFPESRLPGHRTQSAQAAAGDQAKRVQPARPCNGNHAAADIPLASGGN